MQQKKILSSQKYNKFRSSKNTSFAKRNSKSFYFKKYLKNKKYGLSRNLRKNLCVNKKNFYAINILFKSNNFFCTLSNPLTKRVLYTVSSGNYDIKTSKKLLKHTFKFVLERFFRVVSKKIKSSNLIFNITSPIHLRKRVLDIISLNSTKGSFIVQIKKSKCYNGCRPSKKQRKKRKGLKLLK